MTKSTTFNIMIPGAIMTHSDGRHVPSTTTRITIIMITTTTTTTTTIVMITIHQILLQSLSFDR